MNIGEKIKSCRKSANLTQAELAEKSEISLMSIRRYESNERKPNITQIEKIACALGIKSFELIGWEYFDVKHPSLVKILSKSDRFESYLQSLGYNIFPEKTGESEAGYWEEHKDDNGEIIGRSFIPDEEYYQIKVIKGKEIVVFSSEEFEQFQSEIKKSVEYLVWQQSNK